MEKTKRKNNMNMAKLKEQKAITLIALVVTIIVLIILAGISIGALSGEKGIIQNAKVARDETERAREEEQIDIAILKAEQTNEDATLEDVIEELKKDGIITDNTQVGEDGTVTSNLGEEFKEKLKDYIGKTEEEVPEILKPGQVAKTTTKNNYKDENNELATVPEGFHVSTKKGEQNIKDGLVIIDENENEFVWIPCTVDEYENAENAAIKENWPVDNPYKDNGDTSGTSGNGTGNGLGWEDDYTDTDNSKIKETYTSYDVTNGWENNQTTVAKNSIETYNGFYIARYEAGIPTNAPFYASSSNLKYNNIDRATITGFGNDGKRLRGSHNDTKDIKELKPISKKGVQVWNFITQPNSKMIAENMYKGNNDVGSYLVDSQAWNHICKNIFEGNKEGKSIKDSSSWGNYYCNTVKNYENISGLYAIQKNENGWVVATEYKIGTLGIKNDNKNYKIELATGASDEFKLYNIYDMAGSLMEWMTSHNIKNGKMYVVSRGGSYGGENGIDCPVVYSRGEFLLTYCSFGTGFRVVLYIK